MQAQCTNTNTQAITSVQSLAAVQTLLRAGLGCIAYVRNLLPADNFSQSHFTSEDDSVSTEVSSSEGSSPERRARQAVNGFKIMTMSRGYTEEADKILNYLEHGIFDALEKQYLRSFIFGIYLDNNDPNNIVEAYTFNFQYHKIPGSNATIPVMSLDEGIKQMSLDGRDPIEDAVRGGKPPTLRDVKRSVKRLLKALIHSTNNMEALPKRRFATFKVFYTDITPADYEPPNFRAGDQKKDKWYFMTHDMDETPEKWSLGSVQTGHHSVDVNVRSIVSYLPSSTENDDATFTGTISLDKNTPKLSPVQEANVRVVEAEKQLKDAEQRNIAWAVDGIVEGDADADGEDDPDYEITPDGEYTRVAETISIPLDENAPVGMRNKDGEILPIVRPPKIPGESMDIDETHFGGISESVPSHVGQLTTVNRLDTEQTQPLEQTQLLQDIRSLVVPSPPMALSSSTGVPSDTAVLNGSDSMLSPPPSTIEPPESSDNGGIFDKTRVLEDMPVYQQNADDTEMLGDFDVFECLHALSTYPDMETQRVDAIHSYDTIDSFGNQAKDHDEDIPVTPKNDNGLNCECKINAEDDDSCFCEGGCANWYHAWCMGYHSAKDTRLPVNFICFNCRVRADPNWELIKVTLYPQMIARFHELATFRRAIKIAQTADPETERQFIKVMGCDNNHGYQLFKRLIDEGIITQKITTVDELGLVETHSRDLRSNRNKGKPKQPKRKQRQKPKYGFDRAFLKTSEYLDYFNPDPKVECKMLNLPQLDENFTAKARLDTLASWTTTTQEGSQTQETIPLTIDNGAGDLKRSHFGPRDARPNKKVKISLATGVDLAE